jgi:hypothetical protein
MSAWREEQLSSEANDPKESVWWERTLRVVNDLIRHCSDLENRQPDEDPYSKAYSAMIKKLLVCSLFELRSQFDRIGKLLERHHLLTEELESKQTEFRKRWEESLDLREIPGGFEFTLTGEGPDVATILKKTLDTCDLDANELRRVADSAEGLAHMIRALLAASHRTQGLY